jgi:hypothetical protein
MNFVKKADPIERSVSQSGGGRSAAYAAQKSSARAGPYPFMSSSDVSGAGASILKLNVSRACLKIGGRAYARKSLLLCYPLSYAHHATTAHRLNSTQLNSKCNPSRETTRPGARVDRQPGRTAPAHRWVFPMGPWYLWYFCTYGAYGTIGLRLLLCLVRCRGHSHTISWSATGRTVSTLTRRRRDRGVPAPHKKKLLF